jgi:DNA-binding transcriptional regulator YdaS (Cro superfamily)
MQLSEFVSTYGSQSKLARAIGAHSQLVWQWSSGVRPVPANQCPAIERATAGACTCEQLRPDVRWVRIPDPDWRWHADGRPCIDVAAMQVAAAPEQKAA